LATCRPNHAPPVVYIFGFSHGTVCDAVLAAVVGFLGPCDPQPTVIAPVWVGPIAPSGANLGSTSASWFALCRSLLRTLALGIDGHAWCCSTVGTIVATHHGRSHGQGRDSCPETLGGQGPYTCHPNPRRARIGLVLPLWREGRPSDFCPPLPPTFSPRCGLPQHRQCVDAHLTSPRRQVPTVRRCAAGLERRPRLLPPSTPRSPKSVHSRYRPRPRPTHLEGSHRCPSPGATRAEAFP
jgi:hypothetical protein